LILPIARTLPRYELCHEEVRLNRRLAPEVYLAVVPIFRDGRRFLLGNDGESFDHAAQEYAVKMRRLPEDRMLDRLLRTGEANIELKGARSAPTGRSTTSGKLRPTAAGAVWVATFCIQDQFTVRV
jgi:hypothetical protein